MFINSGLGILKEFEGEGWELEIGSGTLDMESGYASWKWSNTLEQQFGGGKIGNGASWKWNNERLLACMPDWSESVGIGRLAGGAFVGISCHQQPRGTQ